MEFGRDKYGRLINYMRISITDNCNLRCVYCNPLGQSLMKKSLEINDIVFICTQAAELGINRLKITGGEPLMRNDCPALIKELKAIKGIEQVTLTTNGVLLYNKIDELFKCGVDGINVSLDTIDCEKYRQITGFDLLEEVLRGIKRAYEYKIPLKINSVITDKPDYNLIELARARNIQVRFIEMMPIGSGKSFKPYSNDEVIRDITNIYGELISDTSVKGNGPAVYYRINGFKGAIGLIGAVHNKFCESCNRIRLTAEGAIKSCLCYESCGSVREAAKRKDKNEVKRILADAIYNKPMGHCFDKTELITENEIMSEIGG